MRIDRIIVSVASASVGSMRSAISVGDRLLEEERLAEIAAQQVADPDGELLDDRPVEAELLADVGDVWPTSQRRRR